MPVAHILLALLVTLIWGLNFVVIKVGLGDFPPLLFCALRFALAALPLLVLRGPMPAPFGRILLIGVLLGVVKFGLLFVGMAQGMPAGLSSLVLQSQVFFTILIAALWLGERPSPRGLFGLLLAAAGLVLIGLERPLGDSLLAFLLVVAAALAWSFANIATKRSGATDMLRLICWVSLVPPLPLLALSYLFEGPQAIERAVLNMSWGGFGALLYIAFGATTVGFAIWSFLLRHYPASLVTPFALAVPVSGMLAGWLLLGERLDLDSLLACALVFVGLAITCCRPACCDASPGRCGGWDENGGRHPRAVRRRFLAPASAPRAARGRPGGRLDRRRLRAQRGMGPSAWLRRSHAAGGHRRTSFRPRALDPQADADFEAALRRRCEVPWSVKNQARMHLRNGDRPYRDCADALCHWAETCTAVALRLVGERLELLAPLGVDDLLALKVRPTAHFAGKPEVYRRRLREKNWTARWPLLDISGSSQTPGP